MKSVYQAEVVYPAALEEAFESMVQMKRSIDNYKLKSGANQSWIEKQELLLAKMMYFIETSSQTFDLLKEDYHIAKKVGFKKGLSQAERQYRHQEAYGNLSFEVPRHKEQIRAATILNAQKKWNL